MNSILLLGPHRVSHASIESPVVDELLTGDRVRILYSDPPWGDGNMRYWATMNSKMNGQSFEPLTYERLLARLRELIERYVDGYVFLETGMKWIDQVEAMMHDAGCRMLNRTQLEYKSGAKTLPCMLVAGSKIAGIGPPKLAGPTMGAGVSRWMVAAAAAPGEIVFDPCCGMGYSARAAVAAGMRFRGNEFNEKRLAKTTQFLRTWSMQ